MSLIFRECIKTYPRRPKLNPAEWPFRRDELEERIDYWMQMIAGIGSAPAKRFHYPPRQLLHKGRKP